MKKNIILSFVICFCSVYTIAQIQINKIDSLGYKQGIWREFKILPYSVLKENVLKPCPTDSSMKLLIDEFEFNDKSIIVEAIGEYKNGNKYGVWIEFFSNGKMKSYIEYDNGLPKGICRLYWTNGKLKMTCEIGSNAVIIISLYDESGCFKRNFNANKLDVIQSIYSD